MTNDTHTESARRAEYERAVDELLNVIHDVLIDCEHSTGSSPEIVRARLLIARIHRARPS